MQFNETYKCLTSQLHYYNNTMKYETWIKKQSDLKAAFLYVNFYSAVFSAWCKKKSFCFIDEAEAVSLVLQYLQKNVSKIEHDKKRYTSSYIYTVCVNCMSILHWRKCDRERNDKEVSLVLEHDGEEFEILSIVPDDSVEDYDLPEFNYGIDNLINLISNNLGIEYEKLVYHLINPQVTLSRVSRSNKNYNNNPFSDVTIRKKDIPHMLETLRTISRYYVDNFRPDLIEYIQ